MLRIFYICFGTGIVFTLLSVLLGQVFDVMGMELDLDFGDLFGGGISPLKPIVLASFVTVFGGVGIIGVHSGMGILSTTIIAFVIAFMTAWLLFRYIVVPLYKAQNTSAVEQQSLIGHIAQVTLGMKEAQFGRMKYVINGNTYTAPAKSDTKEEIIKGSEVAIVDIQNNTFYVKKI